MKLSFLKFTQTILFLHGFYYAITALWALISLDHFAQITLHPIGDPFEMHSIATMALVLGITFAYVAWQWKKNQEKNAQLIRFTVWLALGMALAIILPELYYLPKEGFSWFWFDLVEEVIIAGIFAVWLWKERR